MVQGGGVDGRDASGSGILLTESSDISRRILSSLLKEKKKKRKLETYLILFYSNQNFQQFQLGGILNSIPTCFLVGLKQYVAFFFSVHKTNSKMYWTLCQPKYPKMHRSSEDTAKTSNMTADGNQSSSGATPTYSKVQEFAICDIFYTKLWLAGWQEALRK